MPRVKKLTPKHLDFISWYTSPASPTYGNASQSAIRAGFSEQYSRSAAYRTLVPLAEKHMKKKLAAADPDQSRADFYDELLRTAEQNIKKDMQREDKGDAKVMQIKQKASLFTAERIGKDRWSARTETVNSGKTVLPENVVESLADTLHKLAANQPQAIDPADQSTYTVREDGETVRNEDENDKNS